MTRSPQALLLLALVGAVLTAVLVHLPPSGTPQDAALALALTLAVVGLTRAPVVARRGLRVPAVTPVQARRRTQAPPAWTVTRVPRTPRCPRAPGGR